ncbi:MAG: hypothetical protein WAK34_07675 [Rhodoplanes sp.]
MIALDPMTVSPRRLVASENSIRPDRHLIGLFSALLVGRENSLFFEKIPCYGSKNSLFRCVGNFSAKH